LQLQTQILYSGEQEPFRNFVEVAVVAAVGFDCDIALWMVV
jgi:hypothetical protein